MIEPFISLTTSKNQTYFDLEKSFKLLYTDLKSIPAEALLDTSKPAFSFISVERYESTKYKDELLIPLKQIIDQHKEEILSVIELVLPKLAEGWHRQKAEQFAFGEFEGKESICETFSNKEKLAKAPINNLDPERSVGSINNELKIRGAKNLSTASRHHVINKSLPAVDKKMDKRFMKMTSSDGEFTKVLDSWNNAQKELMKEGASAKESANISIEKQRNGDLSYLKSLGGRLHHLMRFRSSCLTVTFLRKIKMIDYTKKLDLPRIQL